MSIRGIRENALERKHYLTSVKSFIPYSSSGWVRNPSWSALPSVTSSDQKFVGLFSVYSDSNFLAFSVAGAYTVDWGDGTSTENFSSGTTAYHNYDYTVSGLDNTNAPVTFTDSGDTVNRTSHGYSNGDRIKFYNINDLM